MAQADRRASRIERTLKAALKRAGGQGAPPRLAEALHYAVFPGGARVRPHLCLAVAAACGDDAPGLSEAAAAAVELLHCASLAHDDLPCFDDAATRRGRPSVHAAFNSALAVLAGDALIVLAFETLARAAAPQPQRLPGLTLAIAKGVGAPSGLAAGQAWESEPRIDRCAYHQAKTGALFVAAVTGGAIAAGADPAPWAPVGQRLGEAYQVADDLLDALATSAEAGKPIAQDQGHDRPSAVRELGVEGAARRLEDLIEAARAAVPPCRGAASLRELVRLQATRLVPKSLALTAA